MRYAIGDREQGSGDNQNRPVDRDHGHLESVLDIEPVRDRERHERSGNTGTAKEQQNSDCPEYAACRRYREAGKQERRAHHRVTGFVERGEHAMRVVLRPRREAIQFAEVAAS